MCFGAQSADSLETDEGWLLRSSGPKHLPLTNCSWAQVKLTWTEVLLSIPDLFIGLIVIEWLLCASPGNSRLYVMTEIPALTELIF